MSTIPGAIQILDWYHVVDHLWGETRKQKCLACLDSIGLYGDGNRPGANGIRHFP